MGTGNTRGGLRCVDIIQNAYQRAMRARLKRRRAEALGLKIATASAKVAYRHCKRFMAEMTGAREL